MIKIKIFVYLRELYVWSNVHWVDLKLNPSPKIVSKVVKQYNIVFLNKIITTYTATYDVFKSCYTTIISITKTLIGGRDTLT